MKLINKITQIKQIITPICDLKTTFDSLLQKIELIKGELNLNKIYYTIGDEMKKVKISTVISIIDDARENAIVRYFKLKNAYQEGFFEERLQKIKITKFKMHQQVFNKKQTVFCKNRIGQLKKNLPGLKSFLNKIEESNSIISPLILKGEVIGVLEIFSKNLTKKDVNFVKNFTQDLTLSIANTILFQEIKKSEERYRELWDNAPVAYHVLDTRGIIRKVNKSEAKMLGSPQELMIGRSIFEFILPEQRAEARQRFKKKISGEKIPKTENRIYVKRGGTKIYVSIDDILEYDHTGKIIGIRTTMIDITERKNAEKVLKIKNDAIESSLDAIAISDLGGKITYVNPSFLKFWNYKNKNEVIGKSAAEFWRSKTKAAEIIKILKKKNKWSGELMAKKKNGSFFNVQISASVVMNEAGKPISLMASFVDITKLKTTQRALLDSEKKYRKLVDNANDGVIIINTKGYITFANKAFCKISGYSKKDLTNFHFFRLVHPDELDAIKKRFQGRLKRDGIAPNYEFKAIDKKGGIKFVSTSGTPMVEGGKTIGVQEIVRDITEKKKLQKKIEQAKEHFEQIIDTIQDGICVIDRNFKIVGCNKEFAKQAKLSFSQIKGKKCQEVIPHYKNELFKNHCAHMMCGNGCLVDKVFLEGKKLSFVEREKDNMGKIFYHRIIIFPAKNNKGEVYQIVLVVEDITEGKKAEEKIKQLHEFNKRILDNSPVSIIVLDKKGIVIAVNNLAKKIMNKTDEQAINRKLTNTKSIKNNKELLKKYHLLLREGKPFFYKNMSYSPEKSKKQLFLNIIAVPLFDKNKKIDGAISMALDNTEAISAKRKLEELNRNLEQRVIERTNQLDKINKQLNKILELKSKFISDASHELRTPLTIIQGNLDLAIRETKNLNNDIPETFSLINKEIEQISSILTDLTMLTNSDSQTERLAYEKIDLAQLIKAVSQSLGILALQKNITIKNKASSDNFNIMGDEAKLEKLLLNIVRNAIKYNKENGWVKIWTEKINDEARIIVEDNGLGIPRQDLPYIFERFYRVDKSRSRNEEGGTGLGLSIAKWIAEAHKGKISAESTLGKGSKFTIHLPLDYKNQKKAIGLFE